MAQADSARLRRMHRDRADQVAGLRQRLFYVCVLHYGGHTCAMAKDLGIRCQSLFAMLHNGRMPILKAVIRIAQSGVVNAEWLLCGTGPISAASPDSPKLFDVPGVLQSAYTTFNSADVQYRRGKVRKLPARQVPPPDLVTAAIPLARAVHASRVAHRPVILYLDAHAVQDGAGGVAAEFLRKGYATGIACSSAAAQADLALALLGGNPDAAFRHELAELLRAAYLAAAHGLGYGEALGRWSYPVNARRRESFLATAHELHLPATVHAALGEAEYHFFPANGGAEFGAALGAASYADLRIFTEQLRQCGEAPGGVFIAVETGAAGAQLVRNAQAALVTNDRTPVAALTLGRLAPPPHDEQDNEHCIRGEPRLTLPALLTACDAVYDGSADDARSSRGTRNYRVKRNR